MVVLVPVVVAALFLWQPWDDGSGDPSSETPAVGGSPTATPRAADTELSAILATTALSIGLNRLSFLVVGPKALVTLPQVSVTSTFLPADGAPPVAKEERPEGSQ